MDNDTAEKFYEAMRTLVAKNMRLESRCDALEVAVAALATKVGVSGERLLQWIDSVTESSFQKRLERAEQVSPEIAAAMDYRIEMPDIPDALL